MKSQNKSIIKYFVIMSFLIAGMFLGPTASLASSQDTSGKMEVHFIDVGQGDSTLITCDGRAMLIDAGDESKGTAIQNYIQKKGIGKLDYLVLTHPDTDHIGGAPVIVTKFDIDTVFMSNYKGENDTYEKLIQALDYKRLKYSTPPAGSQYRLGSAVITILSPARTYDNPNDASIALMIRNGDNRFLFTGDASENAEADMIAEHADLAADVYHAGHHGSRTSTSDQFFQKVSPSCAVISCAEGNSYGHPSAQTLNTFRMNGVKVYRTDEEGTIIAISDGTDITFDVPPSESWKAGEPAGSIDDSQSLAASAGQEITEETEGFSDTTGITYVLNINIRKFHKPACGSVKTIKDKNRRDSTDSRETIIENDFVPCKRCNP